MSMNISRPKRISTENTSSAESREAVSLVASAVNTFMNEVYIAIMGKLGMDSNLNMNYVTITVEVDGSGIPKRTTSFQSKVIGTRGISVIRAFKAVPTNQPFVTFTENSGIIQVTHISGLAADTEYQLNLLIFGS